MVRQKEAIVLFSGGRDSSCSAVLLAKERYAIKLYTFQAGAPELIGPEGDSAPSIRHKELVKVFPGNISNDRIIEGSTYLIRKLALEKINKEHVVFPIALALAFQTHAICYCLRNGIKVVACGYSGYQARKEEKYIEQRKDFAKLSKKLFAEFGISYLMPVIEKTEEEIKDILEQYGISSNSLENKSIFGGLPFDKENALQFWNSSIPICKKFINNQCI